MGFIILFILNCLLFKNIATVTVKNKSEINVYDDWPRNFNVFPILPMAAPQSTNKICKTESEFFIENLFNMTTWAYQIWDASAKGVVGQAVGSVHNFGDFDECLAIKGPIKTQYCLAEITINTTPTKEIDKYIDKYEPYEHLANRLYYTNVDQKMRRDKAFWALCVPKSCSNKEMEIAVNNYLKRQSENLTPNISYSVNITNEFCQTVDRKSDKYSTGDILFCIFIILLALLVFIGTLLDTSECYEITESKNAKKPVAIHLCKAFSLRKNVKNLIKFNKSFPRLNALFGIRLVAIITVVVGHRMGVIIVGGPLQNKQYRYDMYVSWLYGPLCHADIIVDLFFFLGGVLLTVTLLTLFEKKIYNPFQIMFARYMRLTPLYAIVIFYYATIFEKTGSGPFWKKVNEQEAQFCRENWWTNLLYINNYVNTNRMCMIESWYLPCDFHFCIVGLFVVRVLKKSQRLGLSLLIGLLFLSLVIPFLTVYLGNKQALLLYYESFIANPRDDDFYRTVYMRSHIRASPYFVGMLIGYFFYKMRDSTFKIKQVTSSALAILGLAIMVASISSGLVFYVPGKQYNALESAIYASLNRFSWAVGLGLFLLALGFGDVPILGPLLSWEPLIPFSKLAYGVYILHMQFMYETVGATRHTIHASNYGVTRWSIADVLLSFVLALVAYVCVESPLKNVFQLMFANPSKQSPEEVKTNEPQITRIQPIIKQNEV